MSRPPSEIKTEDFVSTTQRNGDIITVVSLPDANRGISVVVLSKCNIFRQFKRKGVIARGGLENMTILFGKVEFFYLVGNLRLVAVPVQRDHNYSYYTTPIFGECS